jgi:hypothetical protein
MIAGDGVDKIGATLEALIAGKPAPTEDCVAPTTAVDAGSAAPAAPQA